MNTPRSGRTCSATSVLELRGDGKAGGGLVLAFQSLASLVLSATGPPRPGVAVLQLGPARREHPLVPAPQPPPIDKACEVTRPAISVLMDEAAAQAVDFALGVPEGGTFVINTRHTPEECARHYRLSGRVVTVPGDDIGTKYLSHPIGNVSVYVALRARHRRLQGRGDRSTRSSPRSKRRHVPDSVLDAQPRGAEGDAPRRSTRACSTRAAAPSARRRAFAGYGDASRRRRRPRCDCRARTRRRTTRRAASGCASTTRATRAPAAPTASPTAPRASSAASPTPSAAQGDRRGRVHLLQAVRRVRRRLPRAPVHAGRVRGALGEEEAPHHEPRNPPHRAARPHRPTPTGEIYPRGHRPRRRARRPPARTTRSARTIIADGNAAAAIAALQMWRAVIFRRLPHHAVDQVDRDRGLAHRRPIRRTASA